MDAERLSEPNALTHSPRDPEVFIHRHVISEANETAHKAQAKLTMHRNEIGEELGVKAVGSEGSFAPLDGVEDCGFEVSVVSQPHFGEGMVVRALDDDERLSPS